MFIIEVEMVIIFIEILIMEFLVYLFSLLYFMYVFIYLVFWKNYYIIDVIFNIYICFLKKMFKNDNKYKLFRIGFIYFFSLRMVKWCNVGL